MSKAELLEPVVLGPVARRLKDTLLDLLNIQSYSGKEQPAAEYAMVFLRKHGFTVEQDADGNVYAVRGTPRSGRFPLLNAHMDSVQGYVYTYGNNYKDKGYGSTLWSNDDWGKKVWNTANKRWEDASKPGYYWKYVDGIWTEFVDETVEEEKATCADCSYVSDCYDTVMLGNELKNFDACRFFAPAIIIGAPKVKKEKRKKEKVVPLLTEAKTTDDIYKVVATYNEYTTVISGDNTRPIGGDDKCGMAIALTVAGSSNLPMKVLFTVSEETGCVGIRAAIKNRAEWFKDVAYDLTLDRRGCTDLIYRGSEFRQFADDAFLAKVAAIGIGLGIKVKLEQGTISDTIAISELGINSVNLPVGYYDAHTNRETVNLGDTYATLRWVMGVMRNA